MFPSAVTAMGPDSLCPVTANSEMPSRTVITAARASSYDTLTIGAAGGSQSVENDLVAVRERPEPPRTVSSRT